MYREAADDWHLESTRHHGPNCISTVMVAGDHRIPIVGIYLAPTSLDSLPDLDAALDRFPGQKVTVLGDLNVDLLKPINPRSHQVAAVLSSHGLEDMLPHFLQRKAFRHNQTWWQYRRGTLNRSRCDYILGTDRRLFQTVSIRDPRHYSSDHYMLKARLLLSPKKSHKTHLQGRKRFPLKPPKGEHRSELTCSFVRSRSLRRRSRQLLVGHDHSGYRPRLSSLLTNEHMPDETPSRHELQSKS